VAYIGEDLAIMRGRAAFGELETEGTPGIPYQQVDIMGFQTRTLPHIFKLVSVSRQATML